MASVLCSGASILNHRYFKSLNIFYAYISSRLLHFYFPLVSVLQSHFSYRFPTHRSFSSTILMPPSIFHILRKSLWDGSLGHPMRFASSWVVLFLFYTRCQQFQLLHNQHCKDLLIPLLLYIFLGNFPLPLIWASTHWAGECKLQHFCVHLFLESIFLLFVE